MVKGPCGKTNKKAGDECGTKIICSKCSSSPLIQGKKGQKRNVIAQTRCLLGSQPVLANKEAA